MLLFELNDKLMKKYLDLFTMVIGGGDFVCHFLVQFFQFGYLIVCVILGSLVIHYILLWECLTIFLVILLILWFLLGEDIVLLEVDFFEKVFYFVQIIYTYVERLLLYFKFFIFLKKRENCLLELLLLFHIINLLVHHTLLM